MRPPGRWRSTGNAARVTSISPNTFASNIGRYSSGTASSIAPNNP
jgi:hypothetical protein